MFRGFLCIINNNETFPGTGGGLKSTALLKNSHKLCLMFDLSYAEIARQFLQLLIVILRRKVSCAGGQK